MYRHFALVTVLLTACLALFAEGENREALTARTEERKPSAEAGQPRVAKLRTSGADQNASASRFSDEWEVFDTAFGRPPQDPFARRNSSAISLAELAEAAGYTPEYLAKLTPAERELLMQGLAESGVLSPAERKRRSAQLAAASARRSGAPAELQ